MSRRETDTVLYCTIIIHETQKMASENDAPTFSENALYGDDDDDDDGVPEDEDDEEEDEVEAKILQLQDQFQEIKQQRKEARLVSQSHPRCTCSLTVLLLFFFFWQMYVGESGGGKSRAFFPVPTPSFCVLPPLQQSSRGVMS